MNLQNIYPAALGICLTLLAVSAGGQTTTGNATHAAVAPGTTAKPAPTTSVAADKSTMPPASGAHKNHATAHHTSHAKHAERGSSAMASSQDSAYRAALRSCVAGPAGQKESCLDNAIKRFGRG